MRTEPRAPRAQVDCWNRIGVRGDGSCPELATYVHCRNCPVYARAAIAQLDVELPAGYLESWTRHIAERRVTIERDTSASLVFRVGVEWLALPIERLQEVAAARTIQAIPHRRNAAVLGVTNVRGELLTCLSLARLLGVDPGAEQPAARRGWSARLIVVTHEGVRTAFPADEVHGIVRFRAGELMEVPATLAKAATTYITGLLPWQGRSVSAIDGRLLFQAIDRSLASASTT